MYEDMGQEENMRCECLEDFDVNKEDIWSDHECWKMEVLYQKCVWTDLDDATAELIINPNNDSRLYHY